MGEKCELTSTKLELSKIRLDLSKKPPTEVVHLISVLKRLEKEGKIKIKAL
jgi:hypothetical protein